MFDDTRIPRRLPLLVIPDGVLLPGASMRFLAVSPANLALVRNRLLSRGSLGRYNLKIPKSVIKVYNCNERVYIGAKW